MVKLSFTLPKMSQLREYIEKHPSEAQRLVGLDYERLIELISQAENLHNQKPKEIEQKKTRIIKTSGGRQAKLSVTDQVLLTVVYLHHLPTFQMLGVQFGVSESAANYIFHYWLGILRELLPASLVEQVKKNGSEWAWIEEILSQFELIVDLASSQGKVQKSTKSKKSITQGRRKSIHLKTNL